MKIFCSLKYLASVIPPFYRPNNFQFIITPFDIIFQSDKQNSANDNTLTENTDSFDKA